MPVRRKSPTQSPATTERDPVVTAIESTPARRRRAPSGGRTSRVKSPPEEETSSDRPRLLSLLFRSATDRWSTESETTATSPLNGGSPKNSRRRSASSSPKTSRKEQDGLDQAMPKWPWRLLVVCWLSVIIHSYLFLTKFPSYAFLILLVLDLIGAGLAARRYGWHRVLSLPLYFPKWIDSVPPFQSIQNILSSPPPLIKLRNVSNFFLLIAVSACLMLAMVLDSTFRVALFDGYHDVEFSRLGAVDSRSVNLWIRYPPMENQPAGNLTLQLYYRTSQTPTTDAWIKGPTVQLSHAEDWSASVKVNGLEANATYVYSWVHDRRGVVQVLKFSETGRRSGRRRVFGESDTANDAGHDLSTFTFQTWPANGQRGRFSFLFGSCIKPGFPYGQSLPGFTAMRRFTSDFLLLLGDFIYIDIGVNFGDYARLYREVLGRPESVSLLSGTPLLTMLDDHEIINNWHGREDEYPYAEAAPVWRRYLGSTNPSLSNKVLYYTFTRNNVAFFVMDVRSHRVTTDKTSQGYTLPLNHEKRSMLGAQQLGYLFAWLKSMEASDIAFKFLVTPVPFSFNWYEKDAWYGFQYERQRILDFIHDHNITNVVFLSGDRHQVGVTQMEWKSSNKTPIVEYSVSPINQFNMPIPWYKQVENTESGPIHFPLSPWSKDRPLFYSYGGGHVQFGRIYVDTQDEQARVVFCLFGEHPLTQSKMAEVDADCGGEDVREQPIFRHVVLQEKKQVSPAVKRKGKKSILEMVAALLGF